jgi:predicted anti-sigma-YlaC factor YlaD
MKCQEFRDHFDDYILGEAEPVIEIQINEHLLECDACRGDVEERETLCKDFRNLPKIGPPGSAFFRMKKAIHQPTQAKKPFYAHWTFRTAALAATFILGMVLMRGVDVVSFRNREKPASETGTRPYYRIPYADTIKFYSAPAKNLARI